MTAQTRFFLAWLRAHAPSSPVLSYFEFPRLPPLDRRRYGSGRAAALDRCRHDGGAAAHSELELRRARLEHARRVVGILEARA